MSDCIHGKALYDNCFECFPPEHKQPEQDKDARIAELEAQISRMDAADAIVVTENEQRLERENAALRERLSGWQRNAAFYLSCALGGEVPTVPPYIDPQEPKP